MMPIFISVLVKLTSKRNKASLSDHLVTQGGGIAGACSAI
jgi:hypothetical protein